MLQSLELAGDAVDHRDFDGALAWKVSDEMTEIFSLKHR
jgi:hypothetical protein